MINKQNGVRSSRANLRSPSLLFAFALFSIISMFTSESGMTVSAGDPSQYGTFGWENLSDECRYETFPLVSGGSKDEKVSCTVFDPVNNYIIVAGNSTSEDYAPAANDHAFAYAVDLDGNWKWGKFFYNVSYAVSTISGCQIDDNNNLVLLGMGDSMPVIMEMDTFEGTVIKFMSLELDGSSDTNVPWYATYGGIHHDVSDIDDQEAYYYVSFIMKDYLQILKIHRNSQEVIWNYQYQYHDAQNFPNRDHKNPNFLYQDKTDPRSMYLIGRFGGFANIFKFSKNNFGQQWQVTIQDYTQCDYLKDVARSGLTMYQDIWDDCYADQNSKMHEILSVVQPPNSGNLWTAGYMCRDTSECHKVAVVMKIDSDGEIQFLKQFGVQDKNAQTILSDVTKLDGYVAGTNDWAFMEVDSKTLYESDGQTVIDQGKVPSDIARAIAWDDDRKEIVVLLEVQSLGLRPDADDYATASINGQAPSQSDLLIVRLSDAGTVRDGVNVNFRDSDTSILIGDDSFFVHGGYYIFGGQSWGFHTKFQNQTGGLDRENPVYSSYVWKYQYDNDFNDHCFYQNTLSRLDLTRQEVHRTFTMDDVRNKTLNRDLFKSMPRQFIGYESRYSGSFDLQDTFKTFPRMCAKATVNLTDGVNYFRGKNAAIYDVGATDTQGGINVINQMDDEMDWIFQNGTSAARFGNYTRIGGKFYVSTENEDDVGKHRTILRGCDRYNKLIEAYLYIQVYNNKYPDFGGSEDLNTTFLIPNFNVTEYELPIIVDTELGEDFYTGNTLVYVENSTEPGVESPLGRFMTFDNVTKIITFRPDSKWYAGRTYKFRLVLQESDGPSVSFSYPMEVTVNGTEYDFYNEENFTDYTFQMNELDRHGKTSITWSNPINYPFLRDNWDAMFDVYIKNVTIREHNQTMPLLSWDHLGVSDDNKTMYFKARFHDPYMLGLLTKKSDRLYIHFKYDLIDLNGHFKQDSWDDKTYYEGMYLNCSESYGCVTPNRTLSRVFPQECNEDKKLSPQEAGGDNTDSQFVSTKNREQLYQRMRIDIQFDFENQEMMYMRKFAEKTYWYLCGVVIFQYLMLALRNIGFLPLWTLIEYMQLCAFIPLYNFRMIPYLYDAFKPFLVSHLVLTDEARLLTEFENDYFNINYDYFGLNIAKLGQALALITILGGIILFINIIVFVAWMVIPRDSKTGKTVGETLKQFRFNVYLRFYMLSYFDLTFFAVMKYIEGDTSTSLRKAAEIVSYIIMTLSAVVPLFIMTVVCRRFEVMKIKQAKESFNTVVLKIDKQSRWRLVVPGYFFFRRLLTACLLSMPIDNTFIFLQYVFILMSSHAYVLYLVAVKPYQSPLLNNYVLSNETFYSALIIAIFIFSDATPELHIKIGAAIVLMTSIFLLIFANFLMIVVMFVKGKDKIKEEIKQSKLKRAEKELMEEEEEEERRQRQKREEEEFTKLPEDTTQMSHYDLNARLEGPTPDGGYDDPIQGKTKKRKSKKNKKKGDQDELQAFDMTTGNYTTEMGNTTQGLNDTEAPLNKKMKKDKKKKRKDKKNKGDDLQSVPIEGPDDGEEQDESNGQQKSSDDKLRGKKTKGSSDEPSGSSSSDKKKAKKNGDKGDKDRDDDGNGNDQNLI